MPEKGRQSCFPHSLPRNLPSSRQGAANVIELHGESSVSHESMVAAINELAETPVRLRGLVAGTDVAKLRIKPNAGLFSPLENIWHLFDIEREGYLVRIRRILTEELPILENLDGDRMAIDRRYNELDLHVAIEGFAASRSESLGLLQGLPAHAWMRRAEFENRVIDLKTLIDTMVEHDQGHLLSIQGVIVSSVSA